MRYGNKKIQWLKFKTQWMDFRAAEISGKNRSRGIQVRKKYPEYITEKNKKKTWKTR